ncbi:MAG TPA: fused MFS/spermidine synthase [Burkholderiales bacterium]|nr:fused MFS/spermidine synthase [Burkholderiales bacterium]
MAGKLGPENLNRGQSPISRALWIALCLALAACQSGGRTVVHQVQSEYSHIRVVDDGARRALYFDSDRFVETVIDLNEPHRLQLAYARTMMLGLAYAPQPSSVLLIGLGGGAFVRFLNHNFPDLRLDVVEIDPEVVAVAREYFGASAGPRTRIFVADGRDYLQRSSERYDLILLDAHLHPRETTDRNGHPLSLQTQAFYRSLHERLRPDGVAVFNMVAASEEGYLRSICPAFAATDVLRTPTRGNAVAVTKPEGAMPDDGVLLARARALDQRDAGFSFEQLVAAREKRQCPS